jgi:hypothetical protein
MPFSGGSRDFPKGGVPPLRLVFKGGVPPLRLVFKGGVPLLFWVFKGGSTLKMRYFYPVLSKFSDERGFPTPGTPALDPPMPLNLNVIMQCQSKFKIIFAG